MAMLNITRWYLLFFPITTISPLGIKLETCPFQCPFHGEFPSSPCLLKRDLPPGEIEATHSKLVWRCLKLLTMVVWNKREKGHDHRFSSIFYPGNFGTQNSLPESSGTGEWPGFEVSWTLHHIFGITSKTHQSSFGWWFGSWLLFSISYVGCHPSHWRTPSFFKMVIAPPTSIIINHH